MSKRTSVILRSDMVAAALPEQTKSYTVISHQAIIDTILKNLSEKGFSLSEEVYKANQGCEIAYGIYRLNYGSDPDMGMMLTFANSYNKQMRFRCAIGGYVHLNKASVIADIIGNWKRKHTGTADVEMEETIAELLENSHQYFDQLVSDKNKMKKMKITKQEYAHLIGELYMTKKLLTSEQLTIIRSEFEKATFPYTTSSESLWTLYNHILVALSKSHPKTWMEQQKLVHLHISETFDLINFDKNSPKYAEFQPVTEQDLVEKTITEIIPQEQLEPMKEKQVLAEKYIGGVDPAVNNPSVTVMKIVDTEEGKVLEVKKPLLPPPPVYEEEQAEAVPEVMETTEETVATDFNIEEATEQVEIPVEESEESETTIESEDSELIFMALSDLVDILDEVAEGQTFSIDEQSFTVERFDTLSGVDGCYVSENKVEEVKTEAPVVQAESPVINPEANEISQEDLEAAAEKHDEIARGNLGVDEESKRMQMEVDNAIRTIISEELYELYGSVQEFTYEVRDRQYNVKLKTGEIVVLLKSEIDSRVKI